MASTRPYDLAARERARQAYRLRCAGHDYPTIAQECGYRSYQAAHIAVKHYMALIPAEDRDDMRQVVQDRLMSLMAPFDKPASQCDPQAAMVILGALKQWRELLALDIPVDAAASAIGYQKRVTLHDAPAMEAAS